MLRLLLPQERGPPTPAPRCPPAQTPAAAAAGGAPAAAPTACAPGRCCLHRMAHHSRFARRAATCVSTSINLQGTRLIMFAGRHSRAPQHLALAASRAAPAAVPCTALPRLAAPGSYACQRPPTSLHEVGGTDTQLRGDKSSMAFIARACLRCFPTTRHAAWQADQPRPPSELPRTPRACRVTTRTLLRCWYQRLSSSSGPCCTRSAIWSTGLVLTLRWQPAEVQVTEAAASAMGHCMVQCGQTGQKGRMPE